MDKLFTRVIEALTWMLVGMVIMSLLYCNKLGITSGPMFIGWDTATLILGAVAGMRLLMWIDPAFREV